MEQQEGFFKELKQIYDIKIPIPVIQQNHIQKLLFYIDLTNTQKYYDEMSKLSNIYSQERIWQGGQLCELQFNTKQKEQQSIFCYYFNKLIQDDKQIQIQNLFRFRTFFYELINTQQNVQIKFVFHFRLEQQNQLEFQEHIAKWIYQILDGSFDKLQDIICVYNKQNKGEMNYCKISSKKIHFNKNNVYDKFDLSFIEKLDKFLGYFQYKQDLPNSIGYMCQQYLQKQLDVALKEFEKELQKLYKDLKIMIEFPVNINDEIKSNQNVSQYLDILKEIIQKIPQIFNEGSKLDKMLIDLQTYLKEQKQKIVVYLNNIHKEVRQFEIYLQTTQKGKSPNEVFNELLECQFKLHEFDIQILQQIKPYQYNYDTIKRTFFRITLDLNQWFEQFDLFLPQSLAYVKRIIPQQQNINFDKPHVFILGMTRVGKSTFLNIVNDPKNIIITQDKLFDVKEKNNKILLSHANFSQSFQMEYLEIDNFIFVDTPGLSDTQQDVQVINHFNIFNSITSVKQKIILLMIDGGQLQQDKSQLITSINLISYILGEQKSDNCLENVIIPVFNKLKNVSTMEQIIKKWETETMKDITDLKQLKILNIIKKAIDKENYIKIYQAEHYEMHEEVQQLELEIQSLQKQYFQKKEVEVRQVLEAQIQQKTEELEICKQQDLFQKKINQIRVDVLGKCEKAKILHQNSDIVQSLNFELKLPPELKQHIDKLLPHRKKFYQHLLNIITNDFIAEMLFDSSINIDNKVNKIYKLSYLKIKKLSDIPKELIHENIQDQFNDLNILNNILSTHAEQNCDLQIYSNLFSQQVGLLYQAFTLVVPNYELEKEEFYMQFFINRIVKLQNLIPYTIFGMSIIPMQLISKVNKVLYDTYFVNQIEKQKQEKLNLIRIQNEYFNVFQKSK